MIHLLHRTALLVTLAFLSIPGVRAAEPGFELKIDAAYASVNWQGKHVLTYRFGDAPPKPYVRELRTPAGVQILRDSPADHVHHRGLMYGVFVNGVDFWSEQPGAGKQVSISVEGSTLSTSDGLSRCRIQQQLEWISGDKPLATERRSLDVWAAADIPATLVTWSMRLQPAGGLDKVTLTGSHYDGLGIRFVESMDKTGTFSNATGQVGELVRGSEHVVGSKWIAFSAPADQKPVTVALFDHPDNDRHPAGMFSMSTPFSYLSATPNVWKTPRELVTNASWDLSYGVAVWDGEKDAAAIEQLYARWINLTRR
jgi:hypothetical protein